MSVLKKVTAIGLYFYIMQKKKNPGNNTLQNNKALLLGHEV